MGCGDTNGLCARDRRSHVGISGGLKNLSQKFSVGTLQLERLREIQKEILRVSKWRTQH